MFRLVYLTFFGTFRGTDETKKHIHESPITITLPLIVLCVLSVLGGILGLPSVFHATHLFATYLSSVTEPSKAFLHQHEVVSHSTELMLMSFAGIAAIVSIWYAYQKYVTKGEQPADEASLTGLNKWVSNKFYVDELYDKTIVKPMLVLSDLFMVVVDKLIIDLAVNAIAWFVGLTGRITRLFQTGNTGFYIFAMVLSMVVLFVIRLLA
jgi:NADH-quinone oxidoreductase subunit L